MQTLKEAYKNYFTVGAAVSAHWLDEAADTVAAHFNTVTCENEMKYNSIHPHEYKRPDFWKMRHGETPEPPEITRRERFIHPSQETDFAPADKIYNFAKAHGIAVRGHNLMWHASYPWGIFEQLSADEIRKNTLEHFDVMSSRYPDCYCWDVVNEAVDDHGGYLRQTVFKQKLGDDYLLDIYALARKFFPDAKLCCNDYNEYNPQKRESIMKLLETLNERRLVDVVGCQCHINAAMTDKDFDEMRRSYDMYAELGLKIHITEMDVNCIDWKNPEKTVPENELADRVTKTYRRAFEIFRDYKGVIENVTVWGVSDRHSWLNGFKNAEGRKNYPLLFDENYQPKDALRSIIDF